MFRALKPIAVAIVMAPHRLVRWLTGFHSIRVATHYYLTYPGWWLKFYRTGGRARLVHLSDYRTIHDLRSTQVAAGEVKDVPAPRYSNHVPADPPAPSRIAQPPLEILDYDNATAIGATNFIVRDGLAITPDDYEAARDFTHAEKIGGVFVRPATREMLYSLEPPTRRNAAICLLGQCAGNYAHFMTEVLTKLLVIDAHGGYDQLPVLIDQWLPREIKAILKAFNTRKHAVVEVPSGQPVNCTRLIDVTPPAYAPPDSRAYIERGLHVPMPAHVYRFSAYALGLVRARAGEIVPHTATASGRRLYLQRRTSAYGNARAVVNSFNVEEIMRRAGFDLIETGSMTIHEQIAAFRNAEVVVAPIGAAMTNLIFAPRGCRVLSLSAIHRNADYAYWTNMMEALGHDLSYLVGPQVSQGGNPMHRDFRIPLDDLQRALDELGCRSSQAG
ncbi:MAG: glycosyltransferase family 61 protein [Pseudomonadota bacterium]